MAVLVMLKAKMILTEPNNEWW